MNSVIAITGTPGTGKSDFAKRLGRRCSKAVILELNDIVKERGLFSARDESGSMIVDMDGLDRAVRSELDGIRRSKKRAVIVGHLAPDLSLRYGIAVVTRAKLRTLMRRLEGRHYAMGKITENVVAEALDYCGETIKGASREFYEVEDEKGRRAVLDYIVGICKGLEPKKPKTRGPDRLGELSELVRKGMIRA